MPPITVEVTTMQILARRAWRAGFLWGVLWALIVNVALMLAAGLWANAVAG